VRKCTGSAVSQPLVGRAESQRPANGPAQERKRALCRSLGRAARTCGTTACLYKCSVSLRRGKEPTESPETNVLNVWSRRSE
jgi:hypothetical protein